MTLKIYAVCWLVLSLLTFFVYVADKKRSQRGAWRIPEKALLALSVFGGAWGGYLAMRVARHKTKKWYFHFVNILFAFVQLVLFAFLIQNPSFIL